MKLSEVKKETKFKISPLFKLERKINFKPLLIFTIVTAIILFLCVAVFTLMEDTMSIFSEMFKNDPAMQEVIDELLKSQKISSYFVLQAGQVWGLLGAVYAAFLGCKLVSSNFRNNSYEMLYTQNVSRCEILKNKFIRMIINLVIFNAVCGIVGLIGMLIWGYGQFSVLNYLGYFLFTLLMTIQIGTISFALSTFGKRRYSVFLSIVVAIGFYFLANLGFANSNLEVFNYFTPFAVVFADMINSGLGVVNYWSVGIWTIVPIVLIILGFRYYKNTDLM